MAWKPHQALVNVKNSRRNSLRTREILEKEAVVNFTALAGLRIT